MKNVGVYIAIATISASSGASGGALAANSIARCGPGPGADPLTSPPPRDLAYPDFCDIPPAPKSVRTAQAFRSDVVDVRLKGRDLANRTGPGAWSLGDTESFAETVRREAEPPPPMSTPGGVEAFVQQSKALATPPPRRHRRRH